jgi:hypothetical protein
MNFKKSQMLSTAYVKNCYRYKDIKFEDHP